MAVALPLVLAIGTVYSNSVAAQPSPPPLSTVFNLMHDFSGSAFFDGFEFFTERDPTGGTVDFVDGKTAKAEGLAGVNAAGQVFMRADNVTSNPGGRGRKSVRVTSTARFDPKDLPLEPNGTGHILIVLNLSHIPTGCATWPAFWMNAAVGAWPTYGEIDIIEGVHNSNATVTTLHTNLGCDQGSPLIDPPMPPMTGTWQQVDGQNGTDCYIHAYAGQDNMGCPIHSPPSSGSMGAPFNANGGGIYAFLWTDRAAPPRAYACATNGQCGVAANGMNATFNNSMCDNMCKPPPGPPPPGPSPPPGPPPTACETPRNGFDLDGTNGPGVAAKTAAECCPLCLADKGCDGYTYYQGFCYLKHGAKTYTPSAGRTSALTKPPDRSALLLPSSATSNHAASLLGSTNELNSDSANASCAELRNTDISGPNLGVAGPGKKVGDCCEDCQKFAGCKAAVHFEFGPSGGSGGYCYYKAHDLEVPNKAGATAFVPGKPQPPPPPPPPPVVPTGVKAAWFFPRGSAPADLQPGSKVAPDFSQWAAPYARFYTTPTCPSEHFIEEQLIFDLTLCGQWAGRNFQQDCPGLGDCAAYVRANASPAFDDAYWLVDSLRVYAKTTP